MPTPPFTLRWSEHEGAKPYARPFMVTFSGEPGDSRLSVAVSGQDLLYRRQFAVAVAALAGELFLPPPAGPDPQLEWLDLLAELLPRCPPIGVLPRSSFDPGSGRTFAFVVQADGCPETLVDARTLFEYQDVQAAVAHRTGRLLRMVSIEAIDEPAARAEAWHAVLRAVVQRPGEAEAGASSWPWR